VEVRLRRSVALMLLRLGRTRDALDEMEVALALSRLIGHPQHIRECLADVGALHAQLGANDQSVAELQERETNLLRSATVTGSHESTAISPRSHVQRAASTMPMPRGWRRGNSFAKNLRRPRRWRAARPKPG
jgi:hypothetical protein